MGVRLRIKGNVIHLIITEGALRREITTGLHLTDNKAQNEEVMKLAELIRSKKEVQLVAEENGLAPRKVCQDTLFNYVSTFSEGKGRESQVYKCLPYLEKFGCKNVLLRNVNAAYLDELRSLFESSGPSSKNTQAKYFGMVKQALKKAYRDCVIEHDPTVAVKGIRTTVGNKEALTIDEIRLLIATSHSIRNAKLEDEVRRAFIVGCLTGLRVSDIIELRFTQIDTSRNVIIKKMEKTEEFIHIPIHESVWELLNYRNCDDLVFPEIAEASRHDNGKTTNRYLTAWGIKAGIKKHITWHVARHTNATLLIEYGTDLYTVQKLLGHAHISTTMQYAKVSDKKKIEAVASLPKLTETHED